MNGQLTDYSAAFRRCLETLDVALMRKLWQHVSPNLPQPDNDRETLISIHMARTSAKTIRDDLRIYSHAWLRERGYPSQLPDVMKAKAERLYPVLVRAVGIAGGTKHKLFGPIMNHVQDAERYAILDVHADDHTLPDDLVKTRMREARAYTVKKLLGTKWE